jgi:tRNA U34 5-methylaminomethyl-2-thiouridine-forming methyltransferase MnmC
MDPLIEISGDGSHTLYAPRFGQHYHDSKGAIDESRHVFLEHGQLLNRLGRAEHVHIFEMGFGTGLNLLLVADALRSTSSKAVVTYTTIEAYPLTSSLAAQLNYATCLDYASVNLASIFERLQPGLNTIDLLPQLKLRAFVGFFEDFRDFGPPIDLIFFDAFSPKVNPELWTAPVFETLRHHAADPCVLSTYCAAVGARAAMCYAGWKVARAPGCKTRREMTLASNSEEELIGYTRVDEARYIQRYANGDFTLDRV